MTNSYITIGTYTETYEAHLARIRLDSVGIHCRLLDENIYALRKSISYIIPVRLQVLQQDREMAIRALSGEFDAELDDGELERQALAAGLEDDVA